jgi:hypothetical protein
VRWRAPALIVVAGIWVAAIAAWILNAHIVNHWLAIHTGTVNEPGPYYAFWSGFGSDLTELGVIGAIGTGVYQVVKKYNCHQPGCWRVGNHPAAGGQFYLCYHHHPDYQGRKPTPDLIAQLHRDYLAQQGALHDRLHEIHQNLTVPPMRRDDTAGPHPEHR